MKRIVSSASLFLAVWLSGAATLSGADLQAGCVKIDVAAHITTAQSPQPDGIDVTYTNMCGKDVTAVGFEFRLAGGEVLHNSTDWLNQLGYQLGDGKDSQWDILRAGASFTAVFSRPEGDESGIPSASVAAVIFLDRTAVGDQKTIARLAEFRRHRIPEYQEEQKFLAAVADYDAASVYFAKPLALGPTAQQYARNLKQFHTTPAAWAKTITREMAIINKQCSLFTEHSEVLAASSAN